MNIQFEQTVDSNSTADTKVYVVLRDNEIVVNVYDDNLAGRNYAVEPDKVEDVEYLSELFKYEQVCVFAVLVKLLGKVLQARKLL